MHHQRVFEKTREGTDGKLYDHNTLKRCLEVLLSNEVAEAIKELNLLEQAEILQPDDNKLLREIKNRLKGELVDVQCILGAVFVHAGLTALDVERMVKETVTNMEKKYAQSFFEGVPVAQGIVNAREAHNKTSGEFRLSQRSRLLGEPVAFSGYRGRKRREEYEDLAASQGAIA